MNEVKNFIKMTKYAGMREDLVQAGGGNSSVKLSKEEMLIKASGYQMSEINEKTGYSTVNPQIIVDFFEKATNAEITKEQEVSIIERTLIEGKKPSIEVFLHSITNKFTLHTHPTLVNVLTARKEGFEVLKKLFPEALFVDYATPGIALAKEYFDAFKKENKSKNKLSDIIFLKNHGLIVSAEDAESVMNKTDEVLNIIAEYLDINIDEYQQTTKLWNVVEEIVELKGQIIYLCNDATIKERLKETAGKMWEYQFCPDCMVYCGRMVLELPNCCETINVKEHISKYGAPSAIILKGNMYVIAESVKKAMEIQSILSFSAKVSKLNKKCEMDLLEEKEQDFLLNWDAEKYRKNMK